MQSIITTIKRLRRERRLTHKSIADRLNMARSTYSKIESGDTALDIERLINISKVLDVPVTEILKENGDPVFSSIVDELEMMLLLTHEQLSQIKYRMVAYENLTLQQKEILRKKGFNTREEYEDTPLGGRIYEFGPRRLFRFMVENCHMSVLFERNLIKDEHWRKRWEDYLKSRANISFGFKNDGGYYYEDKNEIEIDDHDYFIVNIILLKLPGGKEEYYQFAMRDFPEGFDEMDAVEYIKTKKGAWDGDIVCFTTDGYDPVTEIFVP